MEEDTVPPVALTAPVALAASTASAIAPSTAGRIGPPQPGATDDPALTAVMARVARPQLRLVASTPDTEIEVVHGRGGPASCGCRACTMARHPATMLRFEVMR